MDFFDNHKKLFLTATCFFVILTVFVAILPALHNQTVNNPLPSAEPLSKEAIRGKALYVGLGCVACHTQQVRNLDMDKIWGQRPSMAADYAGMDRMDIWRNTATLMGTERTGPDLTDLGNRQPSVEWNLVHLYNPRIVVKESIMPAYPYLFELKDNVADGDVQVNIPKAYAPTDGRKVIASQDALQLLAYLRSLKQASLPETLTALSFLYKKEEQQVEKVAGKGEELDGRVLYATHCQACHQADGMGLTGAFPPLKGSKVVDGDNLELYIDIIMNGYDSRPEFGVMNAVGTTAGFTEHEVAAIINYERSSWGNAGKKVTPEEIKSIVEMVKLHAVE